MLIDKFLANQIKNIIQIASNHSAILMVVCQKQN